jgi:hypothetical protein
MKKPIILIASLMAMVFVAHGQESKLHLRDFTPKYIIDTFKLQGDPISLKRRVIIFQQAEGIKSAFWDSDSHLLTVQYNNKLIKLSSIKYFFVDNQSFETASENQKQNIILLLKCCFY